MATRKEFIRHLFDGGWATDMGPTVDTSPSEDGKLSVPFLLEADNVLFERDGGPHKIPGTTKLNSSALESGAVIKGLFDAWLIGTSNAPAQHRIVHVGTTIKKDDADGSFTDLFTGLESGKVPAYSIFGDIIIMSSDSTVDVPKSWDGSTAQNLAGTPPNFAFSVSHQNKTWAAGNAALPSRLYYSVTLDPADWAGSGSGTIDIDPDDGDKITGLASHKNELWVFKGPYRGSIHRITGSVTSDFARNTFVTGVGAVAHNTIFRYANDLGFMWSDGSIRSLAATDAFGDYAEASLTNDIADEFIQRRVKHSLLKDAWIANDARRSTAYALLPVDSATNPNFVIAIDYRFKPPRLSPIPALTGGCIAPVIDPGQNDRKIIMIGGTDGFVRKWGQPTRSIDGTTAISIRVKTPYFSYGTPVREKTISGASLGIKPHNSGNVTLQIERDGATAQTASISQGGTSTLGSFVLGTDKLGGSRFLDRFDESLVGDFRAISYEVTHSANNEDVELHSLSAIVKGDGWSLEN